MKCGLRKYGQSKDTCSLEMSPGMAIVSRAIVSETNSKRTCSLEMSPGMAPLKELFCSQRYWSIVMLHSSRGSVPGYGYG